MLERRQRLDGCGQASAGDERVFTDLGIVAGVRGLSVDGHLKAVAAAEADSHIVVAALAHNGVVGVDDVLRHKLIGALAQALLVGDEAGQNFAVDLVEMGGVIGQRLQDRGKAALHVHRAAAIDLAVDLRGGKRVGLPAVGHIDGVEVSDEQHGLSRPAAVEHRPDRRALARGVLFKIAVMRIHAEPTQDIRHVIRHLCLVSVDRTDGDHIVPAL